MKNHKDISSFDELISRPSFLGGFNLHFVFNNGYEISVGCGSGMYCFPRENLKSVEKYSSFEVGIWDIDRKFVTKSVLDHNDDVIGWQGREEISEIIKLVRKLKDK